MASELEIFRGQITKEESAKLDEIPHRQLLKEAFEALIGELETHGNTPRFFQLRQEYGARPLDYWKNKITIYEQACASGLIRWWGEALVRGEETLTVSRLGAYEDEDAVTLLIQRRTPQEEDQVSVTANFFSGIDEFLRPPTIESKIKTDPDEPWDIRYKVILQSDRFAKEKPAKPFKITHFEREIVHVDSEHQRPSIKEMRFINCTALELFNSPNFSPTS